MTKRTRWVGRDDFPRGATGARTEATTKRRKRSRSERTRRTPEQHNYWQGLYTR